MATDATAIAGTARRQAFSQDDDRVPVGILSLREGAQTSPLVYREALCELRVQPQDGSVVAGVRDEQDQTLRPEIPLLRGGSALDLLEIAEPSFGLDQRGPPRS